MNYEKELELWKRCYKRCVNELEAARDEQEVSLCNYHLGYYQGKIDILYDIIRMNKCLRNAEKCR
jgi:hypothetical protein